MKSVARSLFRILSFFTTIAILFAVPSAQAAAPPLAWSIKIPDSFQPDLASAPHGDIYVTANVYNTFDGSLFRLDSDGTEIWEEPMGDFQRPMSVTSDTAGNALIVGDRFSDGFVRKYSPDNDLIWHQNLSSPINDISTGLAADASGNAYVAVGPWATNYSIPPPGTFSTLQSFSPQGQVNWLTEFDTQDGTYPGNGASQSNGTAVDQEGNIVSMFNNYSLPNSGDLNSYLAKTDQDGDILWIKDLGARSNVFSVDTDSQNNIYAALNDRLIKFDIDGNQIWSRPSEPGLSPNLFSLTIGKGNRIFVAGNSLFSPYVAEYDVHGNLLWSDVQPVGPTESVWNTGLTISDRQLIVAGSFGINGGYTASQISAYSLIPEPGTLLITLGLAWSCFNFRLRTA